MPNILRRVAHALALYISRHEEMERARRVGRVIESQFSSNAVPIGSAHPNLLCCGRELRRFLSRAFLLPAITKQKGWHSFHGGGAAFTYVITAAFPGCNSTAPNYRLLFSTVYFRHQGISPFYVYAQNKEQSNAPLKKCCVLNVEHFYLRLASHRFFFCKII